MSEGKLRVIDAHGRRVVPLDKPLFTIGRRSAADLQLGRRPEGPKLNTIPNAYDTDVEAIAALYAPTDSVEAPASLDIDMVCVDPSPDVLAYLSPSSSTGNQRLERAKGDEHRSGCSTLDGGAEEMKRQTTLVLLVSPWQPLHV
jgi:hypothetical protein